MNKDVMTDIVEKMKALGKNPTPEQLNELEALQKEIDELYALILQNQNNFGCPLTQIKDNND